MTATTHAKPLEALAAAGVSIWLDDLSRERLVSGSLARDLGERHISGVTTNPSIFAAAVKGSSQYDEQLASFKERGLDAEESVRILTTDDVRAAADVLRGVYDSTGGVDGRVSIEVDPRLARDTDATIEQARELWATVERPNVLIKIPATVEGLPAITQVLSEGISVNVTLIFSLERYKAVVEAFLTGLEQARAKNLDLTHLASVASFFVSRVDTEVDDRLGEGSPIRGTAAIANARLAFEHHEEVLASDRWKALAAAGATPQRPLWASTSVKDPAYPDTMYVDELITDGTVNTMPEATIEAFADHGVVPLEPGDWDTIRGTYDDARSVFERLAEAGVDFDDVTRVLEDEGVDKFVKSWEDLLATIGEAVGSDARQG